MQTLDPADRSYQFQATLTFEGTLDAGALRRALDAVITRHEIFRTTFPAVDGAPVSRVEPAAAAVMDVIDVSGDMEDVAGATDRAIAAALARPFDMRQLPLVRWTLVRVSRVCHVLVHVEHHLVHDGWSFNVFLEELTLLYRAFAAGSAPKLQDAPAFSEFARRQRRLAETPAAAEQLAYWKRQLAGAPALLALPTDKRRPRVLTHAGDAIALELPRPIVRGIERLSREHAATPFMTMFAAFSALLARYSSQSDICVGTGVAGRDAAQTERLIGMVVNTIVLRVDLSGDPTFVELLERVKSVAFDGYAHQQTPLERVVEAVAPVRDPSFNPLFSVLFSFHDSREPELDFGGVSATLDRTLHNASSKMDLNVVGIPRGDGMILKWEYNSDLFERESMRRMLEHFACLLERILDEPERRVSRFELMHEPERRLVLEEFAENHRPYPRDHSIDALFDDVAKRTPDACALAASGECVSYSELERRANRLARYLRARGITAGARVALLFERSPDAIVAVLAVLKAGACYVPLDVRYPLERVSWLLSDADVALTLTHGELHERLPEAAAILRVDAAATEIARESPEPLDAAHDAASLAYIMYTSGSTGQAKGVSVTHRGVVRLVRSGAPAQMLPEDVVLQYASPAFDGSPLEVLGALLNGATLAIAPRGLLSLAEYGRTLAALRITVAFMTTPFFHQMVESRAEDLRPLRLVFVGGDVLAPSHALRFVERCGEGRLINGYGPTENATFTTTHVVTRASAARASVPIGRPIGNTSVYVLDARKSPVPVGIPGEIWTGGDGVARGYFNRPELTAERFIADPFSGEPDARLYNTGDLGRWNEDGTLEFLGRNDGQVKVRGFRIELGAVESTLRAHPAVRDAAVSVVGEAGSERILVAHVALDPSATTDARALRAFMSARVPEYEVPSRIVVLDALPASVGGKVDRVSLRDDCGARAEAADEALRGDVEERLGAIWRHVLGVQSVTRNADFFDLGGHSLMAMRVLARLNEDFEIELSLRALFERRTLAALAEAVGGAARIVPPASIDVASLSDAEIEALLRDADASVTAGAS